MNQIPQLLFFFFFNDTATTEIYTLSLHDALPIWVTDVSQPLRISGITVPVLVSIAGGEYSLDGGPFTACDAHERSEEHTSELQSQSNLVCRLLLEKKKKYNSFSIRSLYTLESMRC